MLTRPAIYARAAPFVLCVLVFYISIQPRIRFFNCKFKHPEFAIEFVDVIAFGKRDISRAPSARSLASSEIDRARARARVLAANCNARWAAVSCACMRHPHCSQRPRGVVLELEARHLEQLERVPGSQAVQRDCDCSAGGLFSRAAWETGHCCDWNWRSCASSCRLLTGGAERRHYSVDPRPGVERATAAIFAGSCASRLSLHEGQVTRLHTRMNWPQSKERLQLWLTSFLRHGPRPPTTPLVLSPQPMVRSYCHSAPPNAGVWNGTGPLLPRLRPAASVRCCHWWDQRQRSCALSWAAGWCGRRCVDLIPLWLIQRIVRSLTVEVAPLSQSMSFVAHLSVRPRLINPSAFACCSWAQCAVQSISAFLASLRVL